MKDLPNEFFQFVFFEIFSNELFQLYFEIFLNDLFPFFLKDFSDEVFKYNFQMKF